MLDLCSGLGSVPWMLDKLRVVAKVWECEIDAKARMVAAARAPNSEQLLPSTVWYWASEAGLARLRALKPRLVVAGFPCQSVSEANAQGEGLKGKSGVFEAVRIIVQELRSADWDVDFFLECTDFARRHPKDYAYVCAALGV